MRINTITELYNELKNRWGSDNYKKYGMFYIASKHFESIDVIDLDNDAEVYIARSVLGIEGGYTLVWQKYNEYHGVKVLTTRSLLDANVDENGIGNGYNDYHMFTTKEEAEEYVNPKPKIRDLLEEKVVSIKQMDSVICDMAKYNNTINAIKLVRNLTNCTLLEAKHYVENVRDTYR